VSQAPVTRNAARALRLGTSGAVLACALLAGCATPERPQGPDRCYARPNGAQCVTQPPRALGMLADSTPVSVRVDARCEWNPTGVILQRGAQYRITVTRELEPWPAAGPAEGWRHWLDRQSQRWARADELPLHALVAAQGREARTFIAAGPDTTFTAASGDELLFFANDWPEGYEDNRGCLELEVRKLGP
jgi:hypothetical protein